MWGGGGQPTYLLSLSIISILSLFFFTHPHQTPQSLGCSRLYIPVPRLSPSARGGMLLSCPPRKQAILSVKSRIKTTVFRYLQTRYILLENQKKKRMKRDKYAQFGLVMSVQTLFPVPDGGGWQFMAHGLQINMHSSCTIRERKVFAIIIFLFFTVK